MKITVNLPDDLLNEAMELTRARSKSELIRHALLNLVRKNRIQKLKEFKGKVNLNVNLEATRKRNTKMS